MLRSGARIRPVDGHIPSIRPHEDLGFEQAGHLKQAGPKFGQWLDLAFLQLVPDAD
ncbi:hypothetical protein PDE01_00340 [Paracoccus denitrificans]|nr:hypothetical protein PDE01_00340 [Paracoccus denitrificans]